MKPKPKKQTESRAIKELRNKLTAFESIHNETVRQFLDLCHRFEKQKDDISMRVHNLDLRADGLGTRLVHLERLNEIYHPAVKTVKISPDFCDKPKETPTAPPPRKPYINEDGSVNWSLVPVDTKVMITDDEFDAWIPRYYAGLRCDEYYCYCDGLKSKETSKLTRWRFIKLADE